jgi:hypothetical protein
MADLIPGDNRGVAEVSTGLASPGYPSWFPFSALLRVAPYCVLGGIRVVSNGIDSFSLDSPLNLARSAQGLQKENFKLTLNND